MNDAYDVLVIGGGLVGASLACALSGRGLRLGLVEAVPFTIDSHPGYDERTLALAYGTRRIFEGLGLWPAIETAATPIRRIHVSDRGRPGIVRLDCRDEGVEALGYVATARAVGKALLDRLTTLPDVTLLCPASLKKVMIQPEAAHVVVESDGQEQALAARLLVAADGARSEVRRQLGIDAIRWDYGQTAVIANVTPQFPHGNVAYERFTDGGPLALLPLGDDRCAVIATVARNGAGSVVNLDDEGFIGFLQARFGERLGRFQRVGRRQSYPLFLVRSREHARLRVAIVGNAAHSLHPIAGQGFNLGLRDVAALAEVVAEAQHSGRDPGEPAVLERYTGWRRWDQRHTVALTDGLARLFTNPLLPVKLARNLGLLAFELCPPARHLLARHAMGLGGTLSRLARGLPLAGAQRP